MAETEAITTLSIDGLPKIATGKVRELYEVDEKTLLFVASDRISAYGTSKSHTKKLHISMWAPELGAVSGAKETYSILCGVPAPRTALRFFGSLLNLSY